MSHITFNEKNRLRTKRLAIEMIHFYSKLPKTTEFRIIGNQIFRSCTSVAANFRAVCRARSLKERYSKLCIVVEEIDETLFWIEILEESKLHEIPNFLKEEVIEVLKIMASYRKTLKSKMTR